MADAVLLESGDRLLLEDGFVVLLEDVIADDPATFSLLLENTFHILKEDGSVFLLESQAGDPGAPTIGTATASTDGSGNISVAFTPPVDVGDSPIIDYTAISVPAGLTATGAGSPLTVTGAALDTAYTFQVKARNTQGSSPYSAASNSATATDSAEYAPATGTTTFAIQGMAGPADDPNIVSFKFNGIATRKIGSYTYQVCAFRSSTRKLVLGKRLLPSGAWTLYHYNGVDKPDLGTFELDSHNVAAAEIDADGYVHFCWDMHNYLGNPTSLNYRRSNAPLSSWTGGITGALGMLGTNESGSTYPMFFRDPATEKLYFMFRNGVSGNGDWYFYVWNDATDTWAAAAGTTAGLVIQGTTGAVANAYLNGQPKFSSDWDGAGAGFMHINWMWRMSESPGGVETNRDIMHARWNGSSFTTYAGAAQSMPITIANADVVHAVGPAVDLFNQVDFDLDSNNRPVVALIHNDGGGKSQLYALYHNGTSWVKQAVTSYPVSVMTDFGRPLVVIDKTNNAANFIGTHFVESPDAILKWESSPGNYALWSEVSFYTLPGVAQYEPRQDEYLWRKHKILDMLVSRVYASNTVTDVLQVVVATVPSLSGSISVTNLTTNSYTITSPVAADDVAVIGYQYRINGGSWTAIAGGARTVGITGRTPGATDTVEMRAYDGAPNYSTALTTDVTLTSDGGGDPDPEVSVSQGSRRLTLPEWLRGVT